MLWVRRNFIYVATGTAAVLAGAWLGRTRLLGAPAPPLDPLWRAEFPDLAGRPYAFAAVKGRPLVINFWATWCAPCREEMPDFQKLADTELGKNVQIIGIGIDNVANMRSFAEKMGIRYTLLEGGPGGLDLLKALGNQVGGLPFTLVLDARGQAVLTRLGRVSFDELREASRLALAR